MWYSGYTTCLNSPFLWYTGFTNRSTSLSSCQNFWFYVCDFLCNKISKQIALLCFSCLYSNSPGFISTTFRFHQRRSPTCASRNWVYLWSNIYVYIRQYSWNSNSNTPQLDRPQPDRPTACVIAQQYSSVAFVSLHFHSCTEKFSAFQKC